MTEKVAKSRNGEDLLPFDPDEQIWLTQSEYDKLVKDYGERYVTIVGLEMATVALAQPRKWKSYGYVNHYLALNNWIKRKRSEGFVLRDDPEYGYGLVREYRR